jgi:hypothetical protein
VSRMEAETFGERRQLGNNGINAWSASGRLCDCNQQWQPASCAGCRRASHTELIKVAPSFCRQLSTKMVRTGASQTQPVRFVESLPFVEQHETELGWLLVSSAHWCNLLIARR